jgi:hypothetical protein
MPSNGTDQKPGHLNASIAAIKCSNQERYRTTAPGRPLTGQIHRIFLFVHRGQTTQGPVDKLIFLPLGLTSASDGRRGLGSRAFEQRRTRVASCSGQIVLFSGSSDC